MHIKWLGHMRELGAGAPPEGELTEGFALRLGKRNRRGR